MREKEKREIFVIMPFKETPTRSEADLTEFFEANIKARIQNEASLKYQYLVRRSDDSFDINAQIIRNVYKADVVICDLSGNQPNPNVMYELGMRLALSNKPVILIREKHPGNKRIFDIYGFSTYDYCITQYRKLEDHLIAKLRKFETGGEAFESPVLRILKTEPRVLQEINRRRVLKLMMSFRAEVAGLQRLLVGALSDFFKEHKIKHSLKTPEEMIKFFRKNNATLERLPWKNFVFNPRAMPAIGAFLNELPLSDLIDEDLERLLNTFVSEYYNYFLASDYAWHETTFLVVYMCLGESQLLRRILACCQILLTNPSQGKAKKVIEEMHFYLSRSRLMVSRRLSRPESSRTSSTDTAGIPT